MMTEVLIKWESEEYLFSEVPSKVDGIGEGLYQFYGWHPCYGDDVFLYIGRAGGRRGFKGGVQSSQFVQKAPYFFHTERIKVRLGTFPVELSKAEIEEVKKILIFVHCPPWNSHRIREFDFSKYKGKGMVIENRGNFGALVKKFRINYASEITVLKK